MNMQPIMEKPEKLSLWWLDEKTQKRIPAGVAFYEEKYSEYHLKIDFIQAIQERQDTRFYLKITGSQNDCILFRAEAAVKKGNKFFGRFYVGEGYCSRETGKDVLIDFGPFEKKLVLTLN